MNRVMMAAHSDTDVVARTLWGEARGQKLEGMAAVANVIMNRANKGGWWGNTPRQVCLKPHQFSCWNDGNPNLVEIIHVSLDDPQFKDCWMIASDAIEGRLRDRTHGADHYVTRLEHKATYWAHGRKPVAKIGSHWFYKLRG